MPIFVGNRKDFCSDLSGHAVFFPEEGAEVFVPNDVDFQKTCIERGHQPKKEPKPVKTAPAKE